MTPETRALRVCNSRRLAQRNIWRGSRSHDAQQLALWVFVGLAILVAR